MDQRKGLGALGYLSFYFIPFVFPLVMYFVTKDEFVKHHTKRAWISQLIPVVLGIIYILSFLGFFLMDSIALTNDFNDVDIFFGSWVFIGAIIIGILSLVVGIWNLVQAIKVLR